MFLARNVFEASLPYILEIMLIALNGRNNGCQGFPDLERLRDFKNSFLSLESEIKINQP